LLFDPQNPRLIEFYSRVSPKPLVLPEMMNDLISRLVEEGISPDKAEVALSTVIDWVQEHYPVAGALADTWVRNNSVLDTQ
jgi:hypothetical protein